MKKLLILLLTVISLSAAAQQLPLDDETGLITYKEVIQQKGSQQLLYDRAIEWVKNYYKNPFEVLGQRSPEEGYINGKANLRLFIADKKGVKTPAGLVTYAFKLELKDNKYRYVFYDFQFKSDSRFPLERWLNEAKYQTDVYFNYLNQVNDHILKTIESLIAGMEDVDVKKDEW
jgi:hypothetical protein